AVVRVEPNGGDRRRNDDYLGNRALPLGARRHLDTAGGNSRNDAGARDGGDLGVVRGPHDLAAHEGAPGGVERLRLERRARAYGDGCRWWGDDDGGNRSALRIER